MKKGMQVFFYKVRIARGDNTAIREGTIQAKYPLDALDGIVEMAVNEWKKPLHKIELYEVDSDGALVATTTVADKIDRVLDTHKRLKPDSRMGRLAERRQERQRNAASQSSHDVKKEPASKQPAAPKLTEWTWNSRVGQRFWPEIFKTSLEDLT